MNDLGKVINATMTPDEANTALNNLSDAERYNLVTNHVKPSKSFKCPFTYMKGKNRAFQLNWLAKYQWLEYSISLDAAFCRPCALFASFRQNRGQFVTSPFTNWKKFAEKAMEHAKLD